jgi:hypothetical protein
MPLAETDSSIVADFRTWFEAQIDSADRFTDVTRCDRDDQSTLATRWAAAPAVWFEMALRPALPQVRVGILTDDRWLSEEFEQGIEDSGDTMYEFVEEGFHDAGLNWPDPPVEHFRDQGKYFYFSTALDFKSLDQLKDDADLRIRIKQMFEGYYAAFSPLIPNEKED